MESKIETTPFYLINNFYIYLQKKKMRNIICFILFAFFVNTSFSQDSDEKMIRNIFDNVLLNDDAYKNLEYLCEYAPGRLMGSQNSVIAVNYMKNYFESLGADTIFLQKFKTPSWRCEKSESKILIDGKEIRMRTDALGTSPATPPEGITSNVVEVMSLDELSNMDPNLVEGKIVFFNRPVDLTLVNTFRCYGSAVDQRSRGPELAAKMGASAVIIRSVSTKTDTFPHTGNTHLENKKIPSAAISTVDADILSEELKKHSNLKVELKIEAQDIEEVETYNLIADIKGSEFPDEYIVVGGHIDAWFNSPGAHDDGAGSVMSADVMRVFKELGLKNKRTIRVILYMDEEMYQSGGAAYASYSETNQIKNYLALEADAGGFTPEGFMVDASYSIVSSISSYKSLLEDYGVRYIKKGGSGVDIGPLKQFNVPLIGYRTDSQRYMDLHHSANDTFDKVNLRELQLGSGLMSSLIYLIDLHGL